jgi:hypothetical protein
MNDDFLDGPFGSHEAAHTIAERLDCDPGHVYDFLATEPLNGFSISTGRKPAWRIPQSIAFDSVLSRDG